MNLLLCQKKSVVFLALAICVSAVSSSKVTVDTERYKGTKPNVLILFADDLGYGDLSDYGHPTTSTPNLDSLANKGVKFTQWYRGFHVCSPSRGSMMTGRLPIRTGTAGEAWFGGVFNADAVGGLPTNETTIAKALKSAATPPGCWKVAFRPAAKISAHRTWI